MKIIKRSERITEVAFRRFYEYDDCPGAGFSFECDPSGNIDVDALPAAARESLRACKAGELGVTDCGVQRETHSWREPAVGRCCCGAEVYLANFTNTCECGADYNSAGQRLAPRECWGAETGEHWTECY